MMLTLVTLRRKHIRRPACRTIGCHSVPSSVLIFHGAGAAPSYSMVRIVIFRPGLVAPLFFVVTAGHAVV
jgi:hypothetical protein